MNKIYHNKYKNQRDDFIYKISPATPLVLPFNAISFWLQQDYKIQKKSL